VAGAATMNNFFHQIYLRILKRLCRYELRRIADKYPQTREELIAYHDFMAIECIDADTESKDRILGISVNTANMLENK
jgi:hypothetical protein